jgi:hypothetical protein
MPSAKTPARAAVDSVRAGPKSANRAEKERQSDDGNVALADSACKTR